MKNDDVNQDNDEIGYTRDLNTTDFVAVYEDFRKKIKIRMRMQNSSKVTRYKTENIQSMLNKNPILATALNATIGYETGAQIVKKAYDEKRSIIDVASEMTDLDSDTLSQILDPVKLTRNQ